MKQFIFTTSVLLFGSLFAVAQTESKPRLQEVLDERKAIFEEKAPVELKQVYADGISAVAESGVLENAKQIGDQAPDFTLSNALGNQVSLSEYLKKGTVVLTWYRGGWCT